jgi:hypothetical protein
MVTQDPLARAQAGHEQAFRELTDPHRRDCYRILGSVSGAPRRGRRVGLAVSRSFVKC